MRSRLPGRPSQDVVDDAEGVDHARLLLDDLEQTVVRDGDQRVDLVDELGDALLRQKARFAPSKLKGFVTTATVRAPMSLAISR